MTELAPIKRTATAGAVIITARRPGPHCTRPFRTFLIRGAGRYATHVTDFASEAAALEAHDGLVARASPTTRETMKRKRSTFRRRHQAPNAGGARLYLSSVRRTAATAVQRPPATVNLSARHKEK